MTKVSAKNNDNLLYRDLSYKIVGCFYDVYNELGPAHKEQIYHEALILLFSDKDIPLKSRKRIQIMFRGKKVGIYEPDFIIDESIIIEIKSVLNMPKVFENQLYYYLKGTNYKVGYLVNFGNEHIDIRRRVYDEARTKNPRKSAPARIS
ncbi:MAG: GxxExxY protein [Candidatus Omnitrophota bacterium]